VKLKNWQTKSKECRRWEKSRRSKSK